MYLLDSIEKAQNAVRDILKNPALTHEQIVAKLAITAENLLGYPQGTPDDFYTLFDKDMICDLGEGHAPYSARYILPDYDKLMKEGCAFLRLQKPRTLYEALNTLLVFYRHVPSVIHFPVFMGHIDRLLEPFITGEKESRELIRGFLTHCDRTFGSSFCQMNIGPAATRAGRIILELEAELQNSIPNMTLLYDPAITPDDFAELAVQTALVSANPAFAYHPAYEHDFHPGSYGIASCYNGLPLRGGAFTLSRVRLNRIAEHSSSQEDFFNRALPHTVRVLCEFIEAKIRFLVNDTPFFKNHFLVREGFVEQDRFLGLFGMVGLCECVNVLMEKEHKQGRFGPDEEANQLGVQVMERLKEETERFTSAYSPIWNHHFALHAQVGAEGDLGVSPGARIAIGSEIPLYDHLRQAGLYHPFFSTGVGDIFPFEPIAARNPKAILDVFKGSFQTGMRYISTYASNSDLVRVTGYLVKRSDIEKFRAGEAVINETVGGSFESFEYKGIENRKVRTLA
ncbi:MAG: YjjI family glycine radical enzyme [Treponema sp.]|jgi:YjjI family glycine radical enzyme|nr:YjjI family glycine radical enzyme [Treponema sp.]